MTLRRILFAGNGWERIATFVFIVWATVGLFVNFFSLTLPPALGWADAFFLTLGALIVFLAVATRDGWKLTTINFLIVAVATGVLEAVGTLTGVPFGQYYYTDRVGWKIAGILPFTIPLAWWSIVAGGQFVLSYFLKKPSKILLALCVGLWALGHDILLEPFAWHVREYWWWDAPSVPLQNYVTWFVTAFLLTLVLPWKNTQKNHWDVRPLIVAIFTLATFILGNIGHLLFRE